MGKSHSTILKLALGVFFAAAVTGAAFAAWHANGDSMIKTMYEAGLAWCF